MAEDGGGNIKVVVRCRPLNARGEQSSQFTEVLSCLRSCAELARGATMLIRMEGNQTLLDPPPDVDSKVDRGRVVEKRTHAFTFDKSYWSAGDRSEPRYCSQETLYNDLGKELLDHGFAGFNACILACK
jgi:kinesin family protein 1